MTRLFKVTVNGREYDVAVLELYTGAASTGASARHRGYRLRRWLAVSPLHQPVRPAVVAPSAGAGDEVAQMGGVIVQVNVKVGQTAGRGRGLLVLEAMKMKTICWPAEPAP